MILSMTIWEVSEEAKENGFPETAALSSNSPAISSCIAPLPILILERSIWGGARALETSKAETLHERERNSMGSRGVSGGRKKAGSGLHGSIVDLSILRERVRVFVK